MEIRIDENTIAEMKRRLRNEQSVFKIVMYGFGWDLPSIEIVQVELSNQDEVYEQDGIKVAASKDQAPLFNGMRIKYIKSFFGSRFTLSRD